MIGTGTVDSAQAADEAHYLEIDAVMLFVEEARARAERAAEKMRKEGAEQHLIEAVDQVQADLSDDARRFRQSTLFAVPTAQTSL